MDAELVDPIFEPDHKKRTGNSLSNVPSKKLKRSSDGDDKSHYSSPLKHNMPGVLAYPKKHLNSETNLVKNKLNVPHKIPDRSLLFPNPNCFFLEREGEPLMSIPLNGEGDKIVNKLFDNAIDEYLSFKVGELALRNKYKWIDKWASLRFKQPGTTPRLSKQDAQSLDEILNCDSDSDHELLPNSKTADNLPDLTGEVYQPDLSYTDPPISSTPDVPEESPQENELPIVRPCIQFYNAVPEDFNSEASAQSELTQSAQAVRTSENEPSSRSLVENDNEVIEDHGPAVNTSLISPKGTNDVKKRPRKTVSWSPKLVLVKETDSDDHISSRKRRAGKSHVKMLKTNRRRFSEDLFDSFDQNFGDVSVGKHYRHSSARDYCKRRSNDQSGFSRDGNAHEPWSVNSPSSNDRRCSSRQLHSYRHNHHRQTSWSDFSDSDSSNEDSCYHDHNHCESFTDHCEDHWYDPPDNRFHY